MVAVYEPEASETMSVRGLVRLPGTPAWHWAPVRAFPKVQLAGGATNAPIFNFRAIPICGIMVKQMECWRDPTKRSNSSDERSKGSS
jgi:hypothetical protein